MIKTAIVFDFHGRAKRGQEGPIEIRILVDKKRYYINTGVKVLKQEFRYGSIIDRPDSDVLNERLQIVHNMILAEINDALRNGRAIDIGSMRAKVAGCAMSRGTALLDWIDEQIPLLGVSKGTRNHYVTLLSRMREWGGMRTWSDVTVERITMFDQWLHTLTKPQTNAQKARGAKPELISDAAVFNYHKCLKSILHRADNFGKIPRNPYDRLQGQFKKGGSESVEYLTEDEMKRICELNIADGTQLCVARDLFVFQMYTGLAYSDAMAFDIRDYKQEGGKWLCRGERIKTGVPFVNQLLPPAVDVLRKYGMKLPYLDNADYNHLLKSVGSMAAIETRMHTHLARHTFATFMLRNGVKIENLARMLGHTNITQTQRYAKVLALSVREEFDMIEAKMVAENETPITDVSQPKTNKKTNLKEAQ